MTSTPVWGLLPQCVPRASALGLAALLAASSCAMEVVEEAYVDHGEPSDFVVDGWSADSPSGAFDRHDVLDDEFFTDTGMIDAAGLQTFLESTPYGRCWLADYGVDGQSAAEAIVAGSLGEGLNPASRSRSRARPAPSAATTTGRWTDRGPGVADAPGRPSTVTP
jgi:hypothetical protein